MANDLYSVLGVPKGASQKDIRAAYRKLARKHHPDVNPGDKSADTRFREINAAYEVLSDEDKRRKYDKYGDKWEYADQIEEAQRERGQRFAGGTNGGGFQQFEYGDVSDLGDLGSVFGSIFGRGGRSSTTFRTSTRRGADIEQPIEVTLEEAFHGTTRTIEMVATETCPTCGGSGEIAGATCHTCQGAGAVQRPKRIEVKVPPGVTTGSKVRISKEGQAGAGGGQKGDLLLVISVRPHPRFERRGDDLYIDIDVPVTTAVLAGETEVPTMTARVMLKIPPLTQNGKSFKLSGLGMPKLGREGRGDLNARVRVRLPEHLDDRQLDLFEQLREAGV